MFAAVCIAVEALALKFKWHTDVLEISNMITLISLLVWVCIFLVHRYLHLPFVNGSC